MLKPPLDKTPYPRHRRSRPLDANITDGAYVYVRDGSGVIWVLEDGPHRHVRVLGNAQPAMFAGDLTVQGGTILDVTNLSGAFQFGDPQGLLDVAAVIESIGLTVQTGAVRFFPMDGTAPRVQQ